MINQGQFWRRTVSVRGRANRSEFWTITGLMFVVELFLGALVHLMSEQVVAFAAFLVIGVTLGAAVIGALLTIRRLHDLGRSGWWLVPIYGLFVPVAALQEPSWFPESTVMVGVLLQLAYVLVFVVIVGGFPGQKGPNRFGDPPGGAPEPQPA